MQENQPPIDDRARTYAETAREGFADTAGYLRSIPEEALDGPTGCAKWDLRFLAGHIAGEAIWFPNLVRGVTRGEAPYPMDVYDRLKTLSGNELAARMEEAADQIPVAIEEATPDHLESPVDFGFARLPIWNGTYVSAFEAVFHNWDARAGRDRDATVPTRWALIIAGGLPEMAPGIAHADAVARAPGRYLLQVGDGIGPIAITAQDGKVTVERGSPPMPPEVTLHLTVDQYVRLIVGRFPLGPALEKGSVTIDGDRDRAERLNRIFAGVAN